MIYRHNRHFRHYFRKLSLRAGIEKVMELPSDVAEVSVIAGALMSRGGATYYRSRALDKMTLRLGLNWPNRGFGAGIRSINPYVGR